MCSDSVVDIVDWKKSRLCGSPIICHRTAAAGKSSLSVHGISFCIIVTHLSIFGSANNWRNVFKQSHLLKQNPSQIWIQKIPITEMVQRLTPNVSDTSDPRMSSVGRYRLAVVSEVINYQAFWSLR